MAASESYTGPEYATLRSVDEYRVEVRTSSGEVIGVYPSHTMARRVVDQYEKRALREYLKVQRKMDKGA